MGQLEPYVVVLRNLSDFLLIKERTNAWLCSEHYSLSFLPCLRSQNLHPKPNRPVPRKDNSYLWLRITVPSSAIIWGWIWVFVLRWGTLGPSLSLNLKQGHPSLPRIHSLSMPLNKIEAPKEYHWVYFAASHTSSRRNNGYKFNTLLGEVRRALWGWGTHKKWCRTALWKLREESLFSNVSFPEHLCTYSEFGVSWGAAWKTWKMLALSFHFAWALSFAPSLPLLDSLFLAFSHISPQQWTSVMFEWGVHQCYLGVLVRMHMHMPAYWRHFSGHLNCAASRWNFKEIAKESITSGMWLDSLP